MTDQRSDSAVTAVHRFIEAVSTGGIGAQSLLTDDVCVTVLGSTPLSGCYRGVRQVERILISTLGRRVSAFTAEATAIVTEGDYSVALLDLALTLRSTGKRLQSRGACAALFRTRSGRIVEISLYPDTVAIETMIFGNTFV